MQGLLAEGRSDAAEMTERYGANVVGGPGAFLVAADNYDAFAAAFQRKLTLEIAGLMPGRRLVQASTPQRGGPNVLD